MRHLEKMPGHTRLYRRGAVYYHRAAVPLDIAGTYGKREETFSLKTKDRAEALRLVRIAAVEVDRRFDKHRQGLARQAAEEVAELSPAQIASLKQRYLNALLSEDEEVRLEGFFDPDEEEPLPDTPKDTFEDHAEGTALLDDVARFDYARGRAGTLAEEAEDLLSWEGVGLRLAEGSPSRKLLVRAVQEAVIEAAEVRRRRDTGDVVPTPVAPSSGQALAPAATPLLSVAVKLWADQKGKSAWSMKTEHDNRHWLENFLVVAGDKPLADYRKADGRAFKEVLLALPSNWRKRPETRDLGIVEAAERAKALGLPSMSVGNMNKAMTRILGFWSWASAEYDDLPPAPVKDMRIKEKVRARDKRHPWTDSQLAAFFSSPVYTGCRSDRFTAKAGDFCMNGSWKYWLPLLGLFSGARANELCQLRPDDVKEREGIAYLHIAEDDQGQRVKAMAANRFVPIHAELTRLGFLRFVADQRKAQKARLFDGLRTDMFGYHSDALSDFVSRQMTALGIKTSKTSFHSLRHNFQDACRFAEVDKVVTEALAGREEGGTGGGYGSGKFSLRQLNESLQRVNFPALDLAHLPIY